MVENGVVGGGETCASEVRVGSSKIGTRKMVPTNLLDHVSRFYSETMSGYHHTGTTFGSCLDTTVHHDCLLHVGVSWGEMSCEVCGAVLCLYCVAWCSWDVCLLWSCLR